MLIAFICGQCGHLGTLDCQDRRLAPGVVCYVCDPDTELPDKLLGARIRSELPEGLVELHTGIQSRDLLDFELGRTRPQEEELAALAECYGVPAASFGLFKEVQVESH